MVTVSKTSEKNKSSVIQLTFLGFVALSLGIICMLDIVFVYGLHPLTSISESATTGNRAGMLLPFALGCMFTYCIAYTGYVKSERIITRIMAVCFAVVAMQVCESKYVTETHVGLLGLPAAVSNVVHGVFAIVGFGLMFVWIAFYFTKQGTNPTDEKLLRNKVYTACAAVMALAIVIFLLGLFNIIEGPYVFVAEEFMLIPAGFALVVKGGLLFGDAS